MRGNSQNHTKYRKGFSLIELVVVVGLFALLGIVVVDVYLLSIGSQRQAERRLLVVSRLSHALEQMSAQVRSGTVDYAQAWDTDGDAGVVAEEQELFAVDSEGRAYHYRVISGVLWMTVTDVDGEQTLPLTTASELTVQAMNVHIEPVTDPYRNESCNVDTQCVDFSPIPGADGCSVCVGGACPPNQPETGTCRCQNDAHCGLTRHCNTTTGVCAPFDVQPHATISLIGVSTSAREIERKTIQLQTTVTSRIYGR